ncbi:DUF6114 domain-containing protein [Micromonospora echinofusca]|uniref:DUF6114 domain-containing protein n=1 Tax=Micromonospora echinofusca TaxID=47858 RepID=UPI00344A9C43
MQRISYAVVASVTALFSLIGVNLGGFFGGLLLGLVGSALALAWAPDARPTTPRSTPVGPAPAQAPPHDPRPYAVLPVLLGLFAAVTLAAPGPTPVHAVAPQTPDCPTPTPSQDGTPPAPTSTPAAPTSTPAAPTSTPAAPTSTPPAPTSTPAAPVPSAPGVSPSPPVGGGDVIRDVLDGIGDLLGGGREDDEAPRATPPAAPTIRPTTPAPASTSAPVPTSAPAKPTAPTSAEPTASASARPGAPDRPCAPASPTPSRPGDVVVGEPLPRIAPDPGQPVVAAVPSKLTGSKVTMYGLRFEGTVDLPTADGSLRALKFTMDRAVTDDFLLRAPGPAGRTMRFATDELTVQGDVAFYATRFVGRLLGVEITLTPDLPLPDGLPVTSPVPITFTDPAMDLAYVSSDALTAQPALKLTLP